MFQADDGILLPDKSTIVISAIEDQHYKDQRINCAWARQTLCPALFQDGASLLTLLPPRPASTPRVGHRLRL